jgi:transglutaminase-like putative cysteine protease
MWCAEAVLMKPPIPTGSWQVLQASRPNVLVIEPDAQRRSRTLDAVLVYVREPVWRCPEERLALPSDVVSTMVIPDVSRLTPEEQRQLLAWAESHRGTQIVTLSPIPLFPAVASGSFLDALYYRLNVILLGEQDE